MKKNLVFITISILILTACKKEGTDISHDLIGTWYDKVNYINKIVFSDSSNVVLNEQNYRYSITGDSIEFDFNGWYDIYVKPVKLKYEFDAVQDLLMIENLNKLFATGFDSGKIYFSKGIQPNKFIGEWIFIDDIVTLLFVTNTRFEKSRTPANALYDYSYTTDSMTIKFAGPEKILVKPLTVKYDFVNDTLEFNFPKEYYPNISQGPHEFVRINRVYIGPLER